MSKYLIYHVELTGMQIHGCGFNIADRKISFSLEDKQIWTKTHWTDPVIEEKAGFTIKKMSHNVYLSEFIQLFEEGEEVYKAIEGNKVKFILVPHNDCETEIEISVPKGLDLHGFEEWLRGVRKENLNLIDEYYKNKKAGENKQSFLGFIWNILNDKMNNKSTVNRKEKVK